MVATVNRERRTVAGGGRESLRNVNAKQAIFFKKRPMQERLKVALDATMGGCNRSGHNQPDLGGGARKVACGRTKKYGT